MADRLGARKNSEWKAVCTAPDFCKTPVGSGTPPIPYQVIADLGQSENCVPNVRFNGDPCKVLDQSVVPRCTGDEPGTAKGIRSGTVGDKVEPGGASSTVCAGGRRVVRQGDPCTLNSANCPGIYTIQQAPGIMGADGNPPGANPSTALNTANEIQAAQEKQGIWSTLSGPVHFVLGAAGFIPALGAIPDLVDAGVYALEGDAINAGVSAAAAVPFAGDAVKAGTLAAKAGKQALKAAEKNALKKAERALLKEADDVADATRQAGRRFAGKGEQGAGQVAAGGVKRNDGIRIAERKKSRGDVVKENKREGIRREKETERELKEKNPDASVQREQYVRDKDGNIVRDPLTGEARRIDHVVIKDGKVIDSVETTGLGVDKREQLMKEARTRAAGNGGFIRDKDTGSLLPLDQVKTRVVHRP